MSLKEPGYKPRHNYAGINDIVCLCRATIHDPKNVHAPLFVYLKDIKRRPHLSCFCVHAVSQRIHDTSQNRQLINLTETGIEILQEIARFGRREGRMPVQDAVEMREDLRKTAAAFREKFGTPSASETFLKRWAL